MTAQVGVLCEYNGWYSCVKIRCIQCTRVSAATESLYELQPSRAAADLAAQQHAEKQRHLAEQQRQQRDEEERQMVEGQRRRKETRERVINEIVQTEQDYLRSINLCLDSFLTNKGEKVGTTCVWTAFWRIRAKRWAQLVWREISWLHEEKYTHNFSYLSFLT